MKDENGFGIRVLRDEWRVQTQEIDQYGRPEGSSNVISAWPTRDQAMADLPNHADQHPYVDGRWVPKGSNSSYVVVQVAFGQTPITDPDEVRASVEAALRADEGPWGP